MDQPTVAAEPEPEPEPEWPSWVWPYWLERQLDPTSPDYTPANPGWPVATRWLPDGLGGEPVNVTNRNWTVLGNLASPWRAVVDPRGLVTPDLSLPERESPARPAGWSLDWWVGGDDRWHFPSRDSAVRQLSLDGTPVIETAMRIPGGDAVHRAFAVREGTSDLVVVEVENRSPVPFAVAFAVRPYHALGLGAVERIELDESRRVVMVDGAVALHFAKPPRRVAASTAAHGDVARVVVAGSADGDTLPAGLTCRDSMAQGAFIFPVPHTATVRVALPIGGAGPPTPARRRRSARSVDRGPASIDPRALPEAHRVASGWRTQGERGIRIDGPDDRIDGLVDRARRHLLLVSGGEDLVSVPEARFTFPEAGSVLGALDVFGYHDEVDQVLDGWPDRQGGGADGWSVPDPTRGDSNGAALAAIGRHWRISGTLGSGERTDELAFAIARAARALEKRPTHGRRACATGPQAAWRDHAWSLEGWRWAAHLLDELDQPDAAEHVRAADWPAVGPPAPATGLEVDGLDLVGCEPLPHGFAELVARIRRHLVVDGAVHDAVGPAGLSPAATARLGRAELVLLSARGSEVELPGEAAWRRLVWLVDHASPTGTWPEIIHPRSGRGSAGAGHDPVATAEVLSLVRDLLVRESPGGLTVCSAWPEAWLGQSMEVHDAPTALGRCSFAVRWHGERPALLWEVDEPEPGVGVPFRLQAPGLDRAWSTTDRKGEALLSAPVGTGVSREGGSFA